MWTLPILKKSLVDTTLLEGMTDVHTHLLPNVDGGSESLMSSVTALGKMKEFGVKRVYLTPHVGDRYPNNNPDMLLSKYAILKECCPADMELYLGAEYMLDDGFADRLKGNVFTFSDKQILVETPCSAAPNKYLTILFDLVLNGYMPVIAHPELYIYMDREDYFFLKRRGYKFQLNLFALAGIYGKRSRQVAKYLLQEGYYDYVGTDFHQLSEYETGMKKLRLSGGQISLVRKLLDNNELLFK